MIANMQKSTCCILLFFIIGSLHFITAQNKSVTSTLKKEEKGSSLLANLTTYLLEKYDPAVRPYCKVDEVVTVYVDMALRQIIQLDEPNQVISLNMWMRLVWYDCQLKWNPEDFSGITQIIFPRQKVWIPDVTMFERVSDEFYGLEDFRPIILYDGTVKYYFPTTIEASCPLDVSLFPFDTQICTMIFSSWAYNGNALNFSSKMNGIDLTDTKPNVEWDVVKSIASRREKTYMGIRFPEVMFDLYLRRKPLSYVSNIVIPAVLITAIGVLGFILPVESGEKVSLQLTVLLSMSVFQLLVADKLPASADSVPLIGVFFTFTLVLCGFASLIQVVVLNLHHRGKKLMPEWCAFYILQPMSTITLTNVPGFKTCKFKTKQKLDDDKELLPADEELWQLLATCVDRLGLMIYISSFCIGTSIILISMISQPKDIP